MKSAGHSRNLSEPAPHAGCVATGASLRNLAEDSFFWIRMAVWNRLFDGFDRRHGTETAAQIGLKQLGVLHPGARYGVRYQAIDPGVFRRALRLIQAEIEPGDFTFVDLGCGKGRAVILAWEYGFREIVGVDISPSLVDCARRNLARTHTGNARIVCQNASAFQFPPGNLVVYLFHPFTGPVFRQTMGNLCRSASGDVWLVYINPVEKLVLGGWRCFIPWKSCGTFALYCHWLHRAC